MSAALLLSLLLHAFLLSMQFGIRGLGLPALHMPWEERRALTPGINVRIANAPRKDGLEMASAPAQQPTEANVPSPDMPVSPPPKALAEPAPTASPTPPPSSELKVVRRTEAPATAARSEARKAVPAKSRRRTHPQARRVRRTTPHVKPQSPIIAKKSVQPDAFVLPPPRIDEPAKQQPADDKNAVETSVAAIPPVEESPVQLQDPVEAARKLQEEEDARRAEEIAAKRLEEEHRLMEFETQLQAEEAARQAAQQRRVEEEQAHRAEQLQAQRLAEENARRQTAELEARRQAEEAVRQEVARRIAEEEQLRARQLQAKMLEEENARRRAMDEEARRRAIEQRLAEENARRAQLEESQRQEAARAQRLAEEQEAQRRAAEAARQQEVAFAEQQRRSAEGGQDRSQGISAEQRGEDSITRQAEHGYTPSARPAQAAAIEEKSSSASRTDNGPIELSDEQMASMGAVQVRKVEVARMEPQAVRELANASQDSRRRTIFGGAEDDIVLKMYIADWLQTVERNVKLSEETSSKDKPYGNSLVTVALRSDGRVENITIHRSNGRAGLDKEVRRIVQARARYKTFPPDLMRRYDVIEIRRVWKFGDGLRILEEGR